MTDLKRLQNGSDIRGIAITAEGFEANLEQEQAQRIAKGLIKWLKDTKHVTHSPIKVAIGQDSRLSGDSIKEGLIQSLLTEDVHVIYTGLSTTPAMFMATQFSEFDADVGVMITASHLPYYYNGIKVFTKDGGAEHEDIEIILDNAPETVDLSVVKGTLEQKEVISAYAQDLVEKIQKETNADKPLTGFKIVLDAGNGAGGFFAEKVLEALGADTTGSQFLDPDGHFPNHIPNPDNKEAMESIKQAVLAQQADLGVIFDTDVDRAAVVDKTGEVINRNNLIAVLSHIVLEEYPGATIVTNSPTSSHLKTFIESLNGKQVRYLCGYRNVINKGIELNKQGIDVPLSIETSGHAAFKENYFLDDGAYVVAKILMLLPKLKENNQELSDLIANLKQPVETQEIRFKISGDDYRVSGESVIAAMHDFVTKTDGFTIDMDNEEGIRVNVSGKFGDGWFLLRMSLHEPLLVLQVENDELRKNNVVLNTLFDFFASFSFLNTDKMKMAIDEFNSI